MKPTSTTEDPIASFRDLDRAMRVAFLVFTGLFSYFAIRLSLSIDCFSRIFLNLLAEPPPSFWVHAAIGGKPV
ncbi:MAG TPA: hypothetical protein VIM48_03045 [Chthoniobacterales bacterium]